MKLSYEISIITRDIDCRHNSAFIFYISDHSQLKIRSEVIHPLQPSLKPFKNFIVGNTINMLIILTSVVCL